MLSARNRRVPAHIVTHAARSPFAGVFADAAMRETLERRGYVTAQLLGAKEIAALTAAWDTSDDDVKRLPYAATPCSRDAGYRRAISARVVRVLAPRLRQIAPGLRILYGGFANKRAADSAGTMPLHQDPSFVDESRYAGVNVWIPLVDLDERNGALHVVPGSHRFNRRRRGFNEPFAYPSLDEPLRAECATPLLLRAGEAVLFAHTLFHCSPPNDSDRPRLAAGCVAVERGAPLFYHYADPQRDDVEAYGADAGVFLEVPVGMRPVRTLTGRYPRFTEPVSLDDVRAAVHGASAR